MENEGQRQYQQITKTLNPVLIYGTYIDNFSTVREEALEDGEQATWSWSRNSQDTNNFQEYKLFRRNTQ